MIVFFARVDSKRMSELLEPKRASCTQLAGTTTL
jgi:hypothetical protein